MRPEDDAPSVTSATAGCSAAPGTLPAPRLAPSQRADAHRRRRFTRLPALDAAVRRRHQIPPGRRGTGDGRHRRRNRIVAPSTPRRALGLRPGGTVKDALHSSPKPSPIPPRRPHPPRRGRDRAGLHSPPALPGGSWEREGASQRAARRRTIREAALPQPPPRSGGILPSRFRSAAGAGTETSDGGRSHGAVRRSRCRRLPNPYTRQRAVGGGLIGAGTVAAIGGSPAARAAQPSRACRRPRRGAIGAAPPRPAAAGRQSTPAHYQPARSGTPTAMATAPPQ